VVRLLFRACGGLVVTGRENVPHTGRVIICANHISDIDPLAVLVTLPRNDFAVMAKEELFRIPLLGPMIRKFGAFPVARDSPDRNALKLGEEILAAERALLIFPEGRLSEDGKLQEIQPGAALLALRTDAPVVPVGLIGTNRMLPYGKLVPRLVGRPADVRIGLPIQISDFAGMPHKLGRASLTARIVRDLVTLTGQNLAGKVD
jgi:1-acyl-sn-glycerol-3-phosphate acyltransferase